MYCVRFGLVTMETDLEELIAIVYTAGKDVEESSKVLINFCLQIVQSKNDWTAQKLTNKQILSESEFFDFSKMSPMLKKYSIKILQDNGFLA